MDLKREPALIACYLAMFWAGDNSTAIMTALPTITSGLHLGSSEVEWVINVGVL